MAIDRHQPFPTLEHNCKKGEIIQEKEQSELVGRIVEVFTE